MNTRWRRTAQIMLALACLGSAWRLLDGNRASATADASNEFVKHFGDVDVGRFGTEINHVFVYRNDSRTDIRVKDVKSSCGCINVQASPERVPPGGYLSLRSTMKLVSPGSKREVITVLLEEREEPLKFVMIADGRKSQHLMSFAREISIPHNRTVEVKIHLQLDGAAVPPVPNIKAPKGLIATFLGWTLIHSGLEPKPARWEGLLSLAANSGVSSKTGSQTMAIQVAQSNVLEFRLKTN